jgi:hypothetical protein
LGKALTEVQAQLTQISAVSTLVLFIIAIALIVKVRMLSSLLVGAVIGAVVNAILKFNGIDVLNTIYAEILKNLGFI